MGSKRAAFPATTARRFGQSATATLDEAYPARLLRVVSVLAAVAGAAAVGFCVLLMVRWYTPLPVLDHWAFIDPAVRHGGTYPAGDLFAQHNEHRPLVLRLLCLLDVAAFRGTNMFLFVLLFSIQALHAALLVYLGRQAGGFRGARLVAWTGLVCAFLFSPVQRTNLTWAWQVSFLLASFVTTAVLYGICLHRVRVKAEHAVWTGWFCIALFGPVLAWLNVVSGILLWPYLIVVGIFVGLPFRNVAALAVGGAAAFFAQFSHYVVPAQSVDPARTILQHPARWLVCAVSYLGGSWQPSGVWLAILPGLGGLALFGWYVARHGRKALQGDDVYRMTLLLMAGFVLLSTLLIAAGRAMLPPEGDQAIPDRYQTVVLLFWLSLSGVWLSEAASDSRRTAAVSGAALLFVLFPMWQVPHIWRESLIREEYLTDLVLSTAAGVNRFRDQRMWMQDYSLWPRWREWMRAQRSGVFAHSLYQAVDRSVSELPQPSVIPPCRGYFDPFQHRTGTAPHQGVRLNGWIWDPQRHLTPKAVVFTDAGRRIIGFGRVDIERPEVTTAISEVETNRVGFTGFASAAAFGQRVSAFGVDAENAVLCEVTIPIQVK